MGVWPVWELENFHRRSNNDFLQVSSGSNSGISGSSSGSSSSISRQTKTRKKIGSTGTCTRYKICIIYQKKIVSP